jgi:mono/diheme cytochrome c family protein
MELLTLKPMVVCVLLALAGQQQVQAQTPASAEAAEGRRLFQQKCALCHVAAVRGRDPYGPRLSKAQVARSEDSVKQIVRSGIGRMPGFQYTLQAPQIDAIVAFLRTLDTPPDRVLTAKPNQ